MPVYELLIYPVTDFETDYSSDQEYADAEPLNVPALGWFTKYYLIADPSASTDPDVSPIKADLKGLPPTTLIGAQIDPLQDEGRAYAEKLRAAGVTVDYKLYDGVTHEFFGMGAVIEEAREAEELAGTDLHRAFAK